MSNIFGSFDFNFRQTEFFLERAFTLASGQHKMRAQKDILAMNRRHEAEIIRAQKPVTQNMVRKLAAGDAVADLKNALNRIIDIRTALFEARAGATQGDRAGFDNALFNANRKAQDASLDQSNLIGWMAVDGNGVRTRTVDLGSASFNILSRSLGATYSVVLDSGEKLRPEFRKNDIELNGEKYLFTELNFVSETDGQITFSVGDGAEQQTFTGRVDKGGLKVASSWVYGNLQGQANRDAAVADVNAALQVLNATERDLNMALIQAEFQFARATTQADAAQSTVNTIVRKQLNEQQALNTAIESRTQIALIMLSLGAQQRLTEIDAIFRPDPPLTNTILDTFGLFDQRR